MKTVLLLDPDQNFQNLKELSLICLFKIFFHMIILFQAYLVLF